MSATEYTRRAVAEIRWGNNPDAIVRVGERLLHQFWPQLAPYFRDILLAPQRRSEGEVIAWTWQQPGEDEPVQKFELAALRKRLASDMRALAESFEHAAAAGGEKSGQKNPKNTGELVAVMEGVVTRLAGKSDVELAGFVCRTEVGLRLHSWGAATAACPAYADSRGADISGVVLIDGKPAAGEDVLLETAAGAALGQVRSAADGTFRFQKITPGRRRVRVRSQRATFEEHGLEIPVVREPVTGLELRGESGSRGAVAGRTSAITISRTAAGRGQRTALVLVVVVLLLLGGGWLWQQAGSSPDGVEPVSAIAEKKTKTAEPDRRAEYSEQPVKTIEAQAAVQTGKSSGVRTNAVSGGSVAMSTAPEIVVGVTRRGERTKRTVDSSVPAANAVAAGPVTGAATEGSALTESFVGKFGRGEGASGLADAPTATAGGSASGAQAAAAGASGAPGSPSATPGQGVVISTGALSAAGGAVGASVEAGTPSARGATATPEVRAAGALPELPLTDDRPAGAAPAPVTGATPDAKPVVAEAPPTVMERRGEKERAVRIEIPTTDEERVAEVAVEAKNRPEAPKEKPRERGRDVARSVQTAAPSGDRGAGEPEERTPGPDVPEKMPVVVREEARADRTGRQTAPVTWTRSVRLPAGEWRLRLIEDPILPTQPRLAGENESIEAMGARLLGELRARQPATLRQPAMRSGLVLAVPGGGERRLSWRLPTTGGGTSTMIDGDRAEIGWPGPGEAMAGRYELDDTDGRAVARVTVGSGGEILLELADEVQASQWIAVDDASRDEIDPATGRRDARFEWQMGAGQAVPAAWSRTIESEGWRRHRIEVPLGPAGTTDVVASRLALVDRRTGWALVRQPRP